ncbi:MAG: VIT1/CCC1 transporter family protein [Actinomycetes bacterium]
MSPAEIHHGHRDVSGGWLRPAVFGASDGLVSNLALIAGVAGGTSAANTGGATAVALAGLAGLAAGAFSMAVGEYVSVASQTELAQAEIESERRELAERPDAELAELTQAYVNRGLDPVLAGQVAEELSRDSDRALEVHVREELGLDPADLPSPWLAAISSFLAFTVGAAIPVLPYLLGAQVLWPTIVLSLIALFVVGVLVARITVRPWWYSGLRQMLLGGAAATLTFAFGSLVGGGLG